MLFRSVVAFFFKRIGGTAIFWGAVVAQTLIFVLYFEYSEKISYLWFPLIGCAACVLMGLVIQMTLPTTAKTE